MPPFDDDRGVGEGPSDPGAASSRAQSLAERRARGRQVASLDVTPLSAPPVVAPPPRVPHRPVDEIPLAPALMPLLPALPRGNAGDIAPIGPPILGSVSAQHEAIDTWKLHEEASARRAPAPLDPRVGAPGGSSDRAPARGPGEGPVETLWVDAGTEIDRAGRSRSLRGRLGERRDEWAAEDEASSPATDRTRARVARWFREATPVPLDDLPKELLRALDEDPVERPFVIVAGELSWSFDDHASLRVWSAIASAFASDPRVKAALEAAGPAVAQAAVPIPELVRAALDRVREAVRTVARTVGSTPIDAVAERHLIEGRGFERRKVWGADRLLGHLRGRGARIAVPAYLPEDSALEAPAAPRLAVRLLAELRSRQDQAEPASVSLRVVGLGLQLEA